MRTTELDEDTANAARAFIDRVSGQYDLAGVILFGSRARRNHRPDSDADIAVVLRGHRGAFLDTKLDLADIAYDVLLETGVLIQPFPVWEEEWQHPEMHSNPALLHNISQDGVRL